MLDMDILNAIDNNVVGEIQIYFSRRNFAKELLAASRASCRIQELVAATHLWQNVSSPVDSMYRLLKEQEQNCN